MTRHDSGDVYWNRYRERSLAEMEYFTRKWRTLCALDKKQASEASAQPDLGSTPPDTTERE